MANPSRVNSELERFSKRFGAEANNYFAEIINEQRELAPETTPVPNDIEVWLVPGEIKEALKNSLTESQRRHIDFPTIFRLMLIDYLQTEAGGNQLERNLNPDLRQLLELIQSSEYSYSRMSGNQELINAGSMDDRMYMSGFTPELNRMFQKQLEKSSLPSQIEDVLSEYPRRFNRSYKGIIELVDENNFKSTIFHEITHAYSGVDQNKFELYIEEAFANYLQRAIDPGDLEDISGPPSLDCDDLLFRLSPKNLRDYNAVNRVGASINNVAEEITWMAVIIAEVALYNCRRSDDFNVIDWARKELRQIKMKENVENDIDFLEHFIPENLFQELRLVDKFYGEVLYDVLEEVRETYRWTDHQIPDQALNKIETDFETNLNSKREIIEELKENKQNLSWLVKQLDREEGEITEDTQHLEKILQDLKIIRQELRNSDLKNDYNGNKRELLEKLDQLAQEIQQEEQLAREIEQKHQINIRIFD